jgi:hypothetical protein
MVSTKKYDDIIGVRGVPPPSLLYPFGAHLRLSTKHCPGLSGTKQQNGLILERIFNISGTKASSSFSSESSGFILRELFWPVPKS